MPVKPKTRRVILGVTGTLVILLLAGMAFVSYFMHAVYEEEESIDSNDVPERVRTAFAKRFPDAVRVTWEFEQEEYDVEFAWRDREYVEASFAVDGGWLSTEYLVSLEDLPSAAREYVADQQGYEIDEIERIERNGAPVLYEVELSSTLRKWECVFDESGQLLNREREGPVLE